MPDVELPIWLDEIKQNIKTQLLAANEEVVDAGDETAEDTAHCSKKQQKTRKTHKVNQIESLIGFEKEDMTAVPVHDEVPTLPSYEGDIHEHTKAIILSFVNVEANWAMQRAK